MISVMHATIFNSWSATNASLYEDLLAREHDLEILSGARVNAQEEERRRIAREIHDGLGASLSSDRVRPLVSLAVPMRDVYRPTQAGIQIHFSRYVCTMGFNVDHAVGRSFITNSPTRIDGNSRSPDKRNACTTLRTA